MSRIAIAFTGQGAQFVGMGQQWFDEHASVRDRFAQASEIAGYDLADLVFSGTQEELTRTKHAQMSLFVLGFALHEVLTTGRRVPVGCVLGHSLGEITALTAAEALSFEDGVRLVAARGSAMEKCAQQQDTGMIAALDIGADEVIAAVDTVNETHGINVQVSNLNTDRQTVLSGTPEELSVMTSHLENLGARVSRLAVAAAFHSTHMAPAVPEYVATVNTIDFRAPAVPVWSTVTGGRLDTPEQIATALAEQLTAPVRWNSIVKEIIRTGDISLWIECGPRRVLSRMIAEHVGDGAVAHLYENPDQTYAAVDNVVREFRIPGLVGLCLGAAAATRNRNLTEDGWDTGVVAPYRELQKLSQEMAEDGLARELSTQEVDHSLSLLRTIMNTKQVPAEEQAERIDAILRRSGHFELATARS